MTFRPQYSLSRLPLMAQAEQFHYSFDSTNTPSLSLPIAAGAQVNNIILPLEADAEFECASVKIALGVAASVLNIQLRTPRGDFLATPYVPLALWLSPTGAQPAGFLFVPLQDCVYCPAGSNWTLDLSNPTSGSVNPPAVTLVGRKIRRCAGRAA